MEVKIIFANGTSVISDIIRWCTDEPISHVALLLDDKWVVHSNLRGVNLEHIDHFKKSYSIYSITPPVTPTIDVDKELVNSSFKYYDIFAIMWLGLRYVLKKATGLKIPKVNLWQVTGLFLCTEWVSFIMQGKEDSTITPFQLYTKYVKGRSSNVMGD